jgi:hypothetical protein
MGMSGRNNQEDDREFEYDVCFSFAGEDRAYVEQVAKELRGAGVKVFYDLYEKTSLWGKDLYVHLDEVYRHKARYCVMFISEYYARKLWTNHERKSAQARAFSENREYILPARFDDTEVPGLPPTVGYISLGDLPPDYLADLVKRKLEAAREHEERKPAAEVNKIKRDQPPTLRTSLSPIEKLQEYLVDDRYRIALYQLIVDQREALVAQLSEDEFPLKGRAPIDEVRARMQKYESLIIPALDFFITGCRWSTPGQISHWAEFIERVANSNGRRYGEFNEIWVRLRLYPTLVLVYAAGMICVANGRYDMLNALFNTKIINRNTGEDMPLILAMSVHDILAKEIAGELPGHERQYTPMSNHLFDLLKGHLLKHLLDERKYETYFDRFEFLLAAVYADVREKENTRKYGGDSIFGKFWGPIGRFGWLKNIALKVPCEDLANEAKELGSKWPPLAAGMFGGSADRFLEIYNAIIKLTHEIGWH